MNLKIVSSIISSTIALHHNEQLKHTPFYSGSEKSFLNNLIKKLMRKEAIYSDIDKASPDNLEVLYDVHYKYIQEASSVKVEDMGELTAVIIAFKKDKKSMLGIAKKII